jgi:RNA polymerase sigma factor (sigma-70 family)
MAPREALTDGATVTLLDSEEPANEVAPTRREGVSASGADVDPLRGAPSTIKLFRRGDRLTLARVYWFHIDRVEQIIRRNLSAWRAGRGRDAVPNRDVEDLVQDTFARAFDPRARLAFDGERDYWPYLATIARNVLTDALRKWRGDLVVDTGGRLEDRPLDAGEAGEVPAWEEPRVMAILRAYIQGLPPDLARVHDQRYVLGASQEEAARALNLTRQRLRTLENKLRSGLRRALKRARISIED